MLDVAKALAAVAAGESPAPEPAPAPEAPEAAPAPEAPAAPAEGALTKSDFSDIIDRLEKGDFGNTEAAHNGNEFDKSAPMGGPNTAKVPVTAADAENNAADGPEKRVRASVERSRGASTPPPPTNLNKSDLASTDTVEEDDIIDELNEGEGAEAYAPIAEGSWAIQYLTDTFAKAFSHLSGQTAALSMELHERVDQIEKSQSALRDAAVVLLKSAQATREPMAKSMLAAAPAAVPASGVVIMASGDRPVAAKTESKSNLVKSVTTAINEDRINRSLGANILARLDSQDPSKVWETLPETTREKILATK